MGLPWCLTSGDDVIEIAAKLFVKGDGRVAPSGHPKDLFDRTPAAILRPQHCDGSPVLLNDDLDALPHFCENCMEVERGLSFAHVYGGHRFHYRLVA